MLVKECVVYACIGALVLVFAAPNVVADPIEQLLPPTGFHGDYDATSHTIHLAWQPPSSDAAAEYEYRVYRNAVLVAETQDTWYEANLASGLNIFHVTTWLNGNESLPSQPLLAQQGTGVSGSSAWLHGPEIFDGVNCPIIGIVTYTNWPFISVVIREYCIPIIGSLITLPNPDDMIVG